MLPPSSVSASSIMNYRSATHLIHCLGDRIDVVLSNWVEDGGI